MFTLISVLTCVSKTLNIVLEALFWRKKSIIDSFYMKIWAQHEFLPEQSSWVHKLDCSPPSSGEVRSKWNYTSVPLILLHGVNKGTYSFLSSYQNQIQNVCSWVRDGTVETDIIFLFCRRLWLRMVWWTGNVYHSNSSYIFGTFILLHLEEIFWKMDLQEHNETNL